MSTKRLKLQAAAVVLMGVSFLSASGSTAIPEVAVKRVATTSNMCGGECGVCYDSAVQSCPGVGTQDSWCGAICGYGWVSCNDCELGAQDCWEIGTWDVQWWCEQG
jgi:hypothetical protein